MSQQARNQYELALHKAANEYKLYRLEEGLYPMIKLLGLPVPNVSQRMSDFEEDLDDLRRVFSHLADRTPVLPQHVQNSIKLPKDVLRFLPDTKDMVAGKNYIPMLYEAWKKERFESQRIAAKKTKNFKRREARRARKQIPPEDRPEPSVGGPLKGEVRTLEQDYPELGISLSYKPKPILQKTVLAAKAELVKFESGGPTPNYIKLLRSNRSRRPLQTSFAKWQENHDWRLGLRKAFTNLNHIDPDKQKKLTENHVMLDRLMAPASKPMLKWKAKYHEVLTQKYNLLHPFSDEDED